MTWNNEKVEDAAGRSKWSTCKKVGMDCPQCGKRDTCTIAPDRRAGLCWRDGGKVWHAGSHAADGNGHAPSSGGDKLTYPTAVQAMLAIEQDTGGRRAKDWTYRDAQGNEVAKVIRLATAKDKLYRPIHRHKSGWRVGDPPGKWPLYRLAELPADGRVFVLEGEKCADLAAGLGLAAVTSAHGSSAASKTDWTPLAGRDCVILPDNDEPGRKYAAAVSRLLLALDPPARVKVVKLPGLPAGGDIEQFLESGGTKEQIELLADEAKPLNPHDHIGGPMLRRLSDVQPEEVQWLWPGRMAIGKINLLFGDPGLGKSFITLDMAARVSTGRCWPDGTPCEKGSVILLNCEDDLADTIRPRLDAACADVANIVALEGVKMPGENGRMIERSFSLADLPILADAVRSAPGVRLVVIDPVSAYLADSDSHKNAEIRGLLAPLARLAADHRLAVVMVTHMSKAAGGRAMYRAMGSLAFIAAARSAWVVAKDKDDPRRRLFLPAKNNIGNDETGLAYNITDGMVAWERDPVTMSVDEALGAENGGGDEPRRGPEPVIQDEARRWLLHLLSDGAVAVARIKAESQAAGMAWRTVHRAADSLGAIREKNGFDGGWQWRLPKPGAE